MYPSFHSFVARDLVIPFPLPPLTDNERCTAHNKAGQHCKMRVSKHDRDRGITVCKFHGGKAPQVQAAAARRTPEAKARAYLEKNGYEPLTDPVKVLADLAGEAVAMKDYFRSQIDQLRYEHRAGEQLRAEVALYERAMDRCVKVLTDIMRLGIAERRARIEEAQAVMMLNIFNTVLGRMDLPAQKRALAMEIIQQELTAAGEDD
jgi:hypothetical protein